jgi:hypothetical protein
MGKRLARVNLEGALPESSARRENRGDKAIHCLGTNSGFPF